MDITRGIWVTLSRAALVAVLAAPLVPATGERLG